VLSHILIFIGRAKQYNSRSQQYDQLTKKADQMHALLAICTSLCPTRLDESIHSVLREKFSEYTNRIQRCTDEGDALEAYQELFLHACPKFISPNPAEIKDGMVDGTFEPQDDDTNILDRMAYQTKIFMSSIRHQIHVPLLRSFLKLYTTLDLQKLARFLEIDPEELRMQLLVFKIKSRQRKWVSSVSTSLLDGERTVASTNDLDIALKNDVIVIAENKVGRRFGDWFLRNGIKFMELADTVEATQAHPAKA